MAFLHASKLNWLTVVNQIDSLQAQPISFPCSGWVGQSCVRSTHTHLCGQCWHGLRQSTPNLCMRLQDVGPPAFTANCVSDQHAMAITGQFGSSVHVKIHYPIAQVVQSLKNRMHKPSHLQHQACSFISGRLLLCSSGLAAHYDVISGLCHFAKSFYWLAEKFSSAIIVFHCQWQWLVRFCKSEHPVDMNAPKWHETGGKKTDRQMEYTDKTKRKTQINGELSSAATAYHVALKRPPSHPKTVQKILQIHLQESGTTWQGNLASSCKPWVSLQQHTETKRISLHSQGCYKLVPTCPRSGVLDTKVVSWYAMLLYVRYWMQYSLVSNKKCCMVWSSQTAVAGTL